MRTKQVFSWEEILQKEVLRLLRGPYSQDELEKNLKLPRHSQSEWELGKGRPIWKHLRTLIEHSRATCDKYGIPWNWITEQIHHTGTQKRSKKPWHKRESTNSPRATSTGSGRPPSGSSAEPPA